jgi:flagella basal body P-ring formation protein FlgA
MNRHAALVLSAAVIALAGDPCAAGLSVELRPRAILQHADEIAVKDVASVESDDKALREGVERVKVGAVPGALSTGFILRSQVERRIGIAYPEILGHISWSGPERVELRVAGIQVSGPEIDAAARAFLEDSLRTHHESAKVEVVSAAHPVAVPQGVVALNTRACGKDAPSRRMCVWVDVLANDIVFRSIPVWLKVEAYRRVLVAKTSIAAGTAYDAGLFAPELRDAAALPGPALALEDDSRQMRLKRAFRPGDVALKSDLEPIPYVVRNQDLTVKIATGAILIEAPGVALSDGRLGSVIRVQNPSSKEIYRARIVDQGVVTVNIQ